MYLGHLPTSSMLAVIYYGSWYKKVYAVEIRELCSWVSEVNVVKLWS